MDLDKKNLIAGIAFLLGGAYCVVSIIRSGATSFYIAGTLAFIVVGVGFLKRAKK